MNWPPTDPVHCKAATCSISPHCSNVYIKVSRTKSDSKAHSAPWNQDIIILWCKHELSPHASVYIVRGRSMCANLRFDVMLWVTLHCYGDQALIVNCNIWPRVAHILCGVLQMYRVLRRDTNDWTLLYWASLLIECHVLACHSQKRSVVWWGGLVNEYFSRQSQCLRTCNV